MNKLIRALVFAIPSVGNIGGLLFLLLFIFSILGNYLFEEVDFGNVID